MKGTNTAVAIVRDIFTMDTHNYAYITLPRAAGLSTQGAQFRST